MKFNTPQKTKIRKHGLSDLNRDRQSNGSRCEVIAKPETAPLCGMCIGQPRGCAKCVSTGDHYVGYLETVIDFLSASDDDFSDIHQSRAAHLAFSRPRPCWLADDVYASARIVCRVLLEVPGERQT